ncbi:MAG: UDP-N-acetylmuramoyl-L-alanine--D-glutamate ligase [Chloroflexi bacterium]|nr:UDP-N-acetylmuramoyl-L-alanine--D-glutamate ligase [Chloroflexota bacterium]
MDLTNRRVLVMGLGVHGGGLGVARWLVGQGAVVTVTDLKRAEELQSSLDALRGLSIEYLLGEHREQDFLNTELVVRGPGVPRESPLLRLAQEHGIPVEMEMGLFVERLPRGAAQVVGITGTKGKTTTTLMVGAMLAKANAKTVVAGNLRISALELLDKIDADTPVVLELSSWQLEAFPPHQISPHIAAITNISPDHLNRYRDLDDYAEAKQIIFRYQQAGDFVVLNFDNRILTHLAPRAFSKVVWTSAKRALNEGAYREGDALLWRWGGERHKIMDVHELRVAGAHNVENALAAIAVASVWGATPEQIASALAEFRGVEHRQELVREINGVRYVNDTTATAPAAAIAAIQAFAPSGIVLIAGGSDKALGFAEMARVVVANVRYVILLEGTATDKLAGAIESAGGQGLVAGRYDDLEKSIVRARELAQRGDVVLLSPGCASFGMFANEFERGERFKRIVRGAP